MSARHLRLLLLIDGLGALVTAVSMAFILAPFEGFFGLPTSTAYIFAIAGALFSCFSLSSANSPTADHPLRLRVIATLNFIYCGSSLAILLLHRESLSLFGYLYLFGEVAVVSALATNELKVARAQ